MINQDAKLMKKATELAFRIIHHPKYTKPSTQRGKKPTTPQVVDISSEQEKKLPRWLRESRRRDMDDLFERITRDGANFTVVSDESRKMKEHLFGGDGYSMIVFDCDTPSFLVPNNQAGNVKSAQIVKIPNPEMKLKSNKQKY